MAGRHGLKPVRNRQNDALANVDPLEFERLIAAWYERQGYRVEHTGTGGRAHWFDGGIDLKLHRDGRCTLVQCKRANAYQVTHNVVHELLGILETEGADRGIVITTGEFTAYARESAAKTPRMELIDGDQLRVLLGPMLPAAALRAAEAGVGFVAAKILLLIVAAAAIWWAFNSALGIATRSLAPRQAKPPMASAAPERSVPAPSAVGHSAPVTGYTATPAYRQPTAEEIAESQRQADEAMRVLAPNTPEVPLTSSGAAE